MDNPTRGLILLIPHKFVAANLKSMAKRVWHSWEERYGDPFETFSEIEGHVRRRTNVECCREQIVTRKAHRRKQDWRSRHFHSECPVCTFTLQYLLCNGGGLQKRLLFLQNWVVSQVQWQRAHNDGDSVYCSSFSLPLLYRYRLHCVHFVRMFDGVDATTATLRRLISPSLHFHNIDLKRSELSYLAVVMCTAWSYPCAVHNGIQ